VTNSGHLRLADAEFLKNLVTLLNRPLRFQRLAINGVKQRFLEVYPKDIRHASLKKCTSQKSTSVLYQQNSAISIYIRIVQEKAQRVRPQTADFLRKFDVVELAEFKCSWLAGLKTDLVLSLLTREILSLGKLGALCEGLRVLD
jgi:hypothetical protein